MRWSDFVYVVGFCCGGDVVMMMVICKQKKLIL